MQKVDSLDEYQLSELHGTSASSIIKIDGKEAEGTGTEAAQLRVVITKSRRKTTRKIVFRQRNRKTIPEYSQPYSPDQSKITNTRRLQLSRSVDNNTIELDEYLLARNMSQEHFNVFGKFDTQELSASLVSEQEN